MTNEDIAAAIISVVREQIGYTSHPEKAAAIDLTASFADVGLDDLDLTEILMRVEDRYGVLLDDVGLGTSSAVTDLIALVVAALRTKGVGADV